MRYRYMNTLDVDRLTHWYLDPIATTNYTNHRRDLDMWCLHRDYFPYRLNMDRL